MTAGGSRQPYRQYKFHNVFSDNVLGHHSRRRQKGEGEGMMRGVVRVNERRLPRKEEEEVQSRSDEGGGQGFLQSSTQLAMAHRLLQGMAVLNEGRNRWEQARGGGEEVEKEERPSLRRERKLRKDDICHIHPQTETAATAAVGQEEVKKEASEESPPSPSPLDLSQPRFPPLTSPPPMAPPSIPSPSLALVLQPPEYEALAPHHPLYATYIFLPSLGVFVHPLALPPELAPQPLIMPHHQSPLNTKCTLTNFTNNNRSEAGTSMVATNKTEAGGGATFCTFKNVKTVPPRKISGEKDQQKAI